MITPSIKPLCSSHGSGCKREVAFISPFIPHSSAGERGGFSKPGGKLTSITLVRPFKALNFLSKYASSIDVSLHCGMQNLFRWTYLKILAFFPPMPETIFSGVLGIIQSLLMVRRVWQVKTNFHSNVCYCFLTNLMSRIPGFLWGFLTGHWGFSNHSYFQMTHYLPKGLRCSIFNSIYHLWGMWCAIRCHFQLPNMAGSLFKGVSGLSVVVLFRCCTRNLSFSHWLFTICFSPPQMMDYRTNEQRWAWNGCVGMRRPITHWYTEYLSGIKEDCFTLH